MKQKLIISAILSGLLLATVSIQAKSDIKTLIAKQIDKNQKKAPKEILNGFENTFIAINLLQGNKVDEAKKHLKMATEDFDKALKNNPNLDIIPLEENIKVSEFISTNKDIKERVKHIKEMLSNNKIQDARALLLPMKDEIDIIDTAISMKVYPLSTKNALDALNKGDKVKALEILETGFSSLISTQVTLSVALLASEDLVLEASSLDKVKKEEATKLLDGAKDLLEKAKLLGYTNKHDADYKVLYKAIEEVQKEIKGKNSIEKFYDKVKVGFKSLIEKTKNDKVKLSNSGLHDSVGTNESKVLANPSDFKGVPSANAKVEETRDKDAFKAKEVSNSFKKEAKSDEEKTTK